MLIKKIIFLVLLLLAVSCGKNAASTPENSEEVRTVIRDYPYYESIYDLKNSNHEIIRATIAEDKGEEDVLIKSTWSEEDDFYEKYHIYTLRVEEKYHGTLEAGDLVDVKISLDEQGAALTNDGIYFLTLYEEGPADIANPDQGFIPIEKDHLILKEDTKALFNETNANPSLKSLSLPVEEAAENFLAE